LNVGEIPIPARRELAAELENLIERYRELWRKRSRPGGLKDSVGRMLSLKTGYLPEQAGA
jgi:hypothetical protein